MDFVYDKVDNNLYAYVTYPNPANPAGNFLGELIKLNATTGILTAVAPPVITANANASVQVAGTLLDEFGNLLILFTDGSMYEAATAAPNVFTGAISLLGPSNLPTASGTLRGDMASCGNAIVLPVDLLSFTAYEQNDKVFIKWQTTSEINLNKFIVQKSTDGVHWNNLTTVKATGNSSVVTNYQTTDNTNGNVFYRLISVDNDGSQSISNTQHITGNEAITLFTTYPNPAQDVLTIEASNAFEGNVSIKVMDAIGKNYNLSVLNTTTNSVSVNVSRLGKGIYFAQLFDANGGIIFTQKFIKE
jgi:hypothetical protein